ncbi:fungal-specific transcription factor domain-containing protein [Leptodontidium sp. 2 PMI_412]|nr:fungal-specific transcription factor domain-containing protein [Leptodontidium sp. 2 PMI_412]
MEADHLNKRRNTTKACQECRKRRTKCDGRTPSCNRCSNRKVLCEYTSEADKRRPTPKAHVLMLEDRINLLEKALEFHSLDVEQSVAQPGTFASSPYNRSKEVEGTLTVEASLNFDQDGEFRYFGPSSGRLQFQTDPVETSGTGANSSTPKSLEQSDNQVSTELKDLLLDLYFAWEQPWCWVVNERLFRESEKDGGRFCNPLLLNSILAIASRFTDRVEVRSDPSDPNTAGSLFFDNTQVLLHYDLKWPTITTIQSLSIMGTMYVAVGADAAGWLHQGMANRLAIDMGLNLDPMSMQRAATISEEEIQLRRQVYWALYCHDKLFASYTGRICTMLNFQGVVSLPKVDSSCQGREDTCFTSLQYSIVTLCQILEQILLKLYAPQPLNRTSERSAFLLSCTAELDTWYRDLPSEMRIESSAPAMRAPQVFTLHMTYHTAVILLHKPFLSEGRPNYSSKKPYDPSTANPTAINASSVCCQAAEGICDLAEKYRQIFGSFRRCPLTATHCTLMAALISLQIPQSSKRPDKAPFDMCANVLRELSDSWRPPKRLLESLLVLRTKKSEAMESTNLGEPNSLAVSSLQGADDFLEANSDITMHDWGSFLGDSSATPFLVGDDLAFSTYTLPEDYSIYGDYSQGF